MIIQWEFYGWVLGYSFFFMINSALKSEWIMIHCSRYLESVVFYMAFSDCTGDIKQVKCKHAEVKRLV